MKATLQVETETGLKTEVSCKLEKLSDLAALGRALQRKARDVSRVFPALASQKLARARLTTEAKTGKAAAAES